MRTYPLCTLLLCLTLLTACTNELPFDLKAKPPKLIMNALMNADSVNNYVFLDLTGRDKSTPVKGASLEIRINGELKERLLSGEQERSADDRCQFRIDSRFLPGDEVQIDAYTDDGVHHARATIDVPYPIEKIGRIDTASVEFRTAYSRNPHLQLKIAMDDRRGERNFYRLIVESQSAIVLGMDVTQTRYIHTLNLVIREDVVLTDGNPSTGKDEENGLFDSPVNRFAVFDDSRFRDASHTFVVYSPILDEFYTDVVAHKKDIVVRILSISETEFYYLKALSLYQSSAYDPMMSEPIRFPSNVHGGTGVVSICTETGVILPVLRQELSPKE